MSGLKRPRAIEMGALSDVRSYPILEIVTPIPLEALIQHKASRVYHKQVIHSANLCTDRRMRRTFSKSFVREINTTSERTARSRTRPALVCDTEDRDQAQRRESDTKLQPR